MIIDDEMLDSLSLAAARLPRNRKNLNFHAEEGAACNRLLNAIEPGSYVQPHRHLDPEKGETIILLKGRLGVLFFSDEGEVSSKFLLDPKGGNYGIDIPHGILHTVVSLEHGTVFFEAKAGPYVPISDAERVLWAPRENEPGAAGYFASLKTHFD